MAQIAVHLSSLANERNPTLLRLRAFGEKYSGGAYALTDDRRVADIVLFVENGYVGLADIPRVLKMRNENPRAAFTMFSECDWPFAFLPGLYTSLSKNLPWASGWAFALDDDEAPSGGEAGRYLYSFLGRLSTHPVRGLVRKLDGPQTPCLDVAEAPQRFSGWDYRRTFAQVLRDSRFVLCPRGFGASSIRIFEAMRAGRVPVIVSDAWNEPPVGDWPAFSLKVRESDVARIPDICGEHAGAAVTMGRAARMAFEHYFGPMRFFETALDAVSTKIAKSRWHPFGNSNRILKALSLREFRSVMHKSRKTLGGPSCL